jgi:hypothetical protein
VHHFLEKGKISYTVMTESMSSYSPTQKTGLCISVLLVTQSTALSQDESYGMLYLINFGRRGNIDKNKHVRQMPSWQKNLQNQSTTCPCASATI